MYYDKGYTGSQFDFLKDLLTNQANNGLKNKNELLTFNKRAIENSIGASREAIAEDFAGRGTFGSAAMAGINSKLAGEKALALEKSSQDINLMDENARQSAIGRLLGLNQFEGQMGFNVDQAENQKNLNWSQFYEQQRQFNKQLDASESGWFEDLMGGVFGAASSVLPIGFMTNWGKGKNG